MASYARAVLAPAVSLVFGSLLFASVLSAQESRFTVALRGGVTAENSEDNLTGTVPAIGATGSVAFSPDWRGEAEFWLPGYLKDDDGEPKHRDVLFSVSALRTFGDRRMRPFVVAGLSFSRTQDWFTFCTAERPLDSGGPAVPTIVSCDAPDVIARRRERNDGADLYLLAGGGFELSITPRVKLVSDVRLSLAPVSVLVRPAVGVAIGF